MRMKGIKVLLLALVMAWGAGCAKKAATAPVPGSINAFDAYAYRSLADAQAALHSVKTWEQCAAANFPTTVTVDGNAELCDAAAGAFPNNGKAPLNAAINAYNIAQAAAKAYHAGATQDTTALAADLTQLGSAVATMLSQTGGK